MLLKAEVHSAGIQDRDGAAFVFDKLANRFPFIEKICADGGYQGPKVKRGQPEIDGDCRTSPGRFSGVTEKMDRRKNAGLARHKPPHGKGFRALRQHRPRLHPNRNDQAHDKKAGPISAFRNGLSVPQIFLDRVQLRRFRIRRPFTPVEEISSQMNQDKSGCHSDQESQT